MSLLFRTLLFLAATLSFLVAWLCMPITTYSTETEPLNAAILYLVTPKSIRNLAESLRHLHDNFNRHFKYPIILFHEEDFKLDYQVELQNLITADIVANVKWEMVNLTFPQGLNGSEESLKPVTFKHAWPNYHHMIRFWFFQVFDHPAVRDLHYYMRLDTDSYIMSPICYDIFAYMKHHKLSYGYKETMFDAPDVVSGLWEFIDEYKRSRSVEIEHNYEMSERKSDVRGYYNNFEVVSVPVFRRRAVRDFATAIDRSGMIYKHRWGDAVLRYAAVQMFVPDPGQLTEQFCDFSYEHQRFMRSSCDTKVYCSKLCKNAPRLPAIEEVDETAFRRPVIGTIIESVQESGKDGRHRFTVPSAALCGDKKRTKRSS